MSILIKGIEMPKNESEYWHIFITPYGDVYNCFDGELTERPIANAIDVSDHGDLIDRDALMEILADWQYTEAPQEGSNWRIDKMVTSHEAQYEKYLLLKQVYDEVKDFPVMVIPAERDAKVCPLHSDDEVTEYCLEGPCTDEMENRCPIAERSDE